MPTVAPDRSAGTGTNGGEGWACATAKHKTINKRTGVACILCYLHCGIFRCVNLVFSACFVGFFVGFDMLSLTSACASTTIRRLSTATPAYPCTGPTSTSGFGEYVKENLEASPARSNLGKFAKELESKFGWPRISLVNSGSSANLAASLTLAEVIQSRRGIDLNQQHPFLSGAGPIVQSIGTVLTAGFTFPSTMSSLLTAGFRLQLVDTEPHGFCLCPDALERAILAHKEHQMEPEVVGVAVTHFLGFPAQMRRIKALCDEHDLLILQDACETMSMQVDGISLASYGDISTWSFYHPHHLSSFGGGAVSSPHTEWQRITESITHWGRACTCHFDPALCQAPPGQHHHFHYVRTGHNLEMSELNACFGRFQLQSWNTYEAQRIANYNVLLQALEDLPSIDVWPMVEGCGSPFVFPIALKPRFAEQIQAVEQRLRVEGVEIRSLMGGAIQQQPAYANIIDNGLENCTDLASRSFFVGVHQTLPIENVRHVATVLRRALTTL